jgi:hypothetical protein
MMGFTCIRCKGFTTDLKFITKKTVPKIFDDYTKIGVCVGCYNKRVKWCASRNIVMK